MADHSKSKNEHGLGRTTSQAAELESESKQTWVGLAIDHAEVQARKARAPRHHRRKCLQELQAPHHQSPMPLVKSIMAATTLPWSASASSGNKCCRSTAEGRLEVVRTSARRSVKHAR